MDVDKQKSSGGVIEVPAPTAWPLVVAFGFTFLFAGLVTHFLVSILGGVTFCMGLVGWFRQVLPHEVLETVSVEKEEWRAAPPSSPARHLPVGQANHRARLPLKIYPYRVGVRGGLVGGVAMAILAILYGLIAYKSVWYPINLLAATASADIAAMTTDQLRAFNGEGLLLAVIIHGAGSALIGLLYGIALPMFPRRPMLLAGILAPLFWTGILYAGIGIINPTLQARIDWGWFFASQIAFGLVAGFVVTFREKVYTMQHLPFAIRAGIETDETDDSKPGKNDPRT